MKHVALFRKVVKEFKESEEYKEGVIDKIVELFKGEEDRDLTPLEQFNLSKFLILNVEDQNVINFIKYAQDFFGIIIDNNEFLEAFNNLFPSKLDTELCSLLESLGLFNFNICNLLVKHKENISSDDYKYILRAMNENEIPITSEIFAAIIQSFNLKRILLTLLESVNEIKTSLTDERLESKACVISVAIEKDKLLAFAKKNVELVLKYILKCKCTEEDFEEIYSDLFHIFYRNEDELQISLEVRHQQVNSLIYEKYFYLFPENQTSFVSTICETVKTLPATVVGVICQYAFFRPPQPSLIPLQNLISLHFSHEAENKEYPREVDLYKTKIENFGSFATQFAGEILISLGIKNKVHTIVIGNVRNGFNFLERLTDCWPSSSENYRYIGVIVPTLENAAGIPGHATLLLFDLGLQTLECIDPLGPRTEGLEKIEKWIYEGKRFDPKHEDLDDDDVEDLKKINNIGVFCKTLCSMKLVFSPMSAPIQQTDQFTCVLHCVANMIGMILYKEDKKPHPECDENTRTFVNSLYLDLKSGAGIVPRSPKILHHLAGVINLAGQKIHEQQIETDAEKSIPKNGSFKV